MPLHRPIMQPTLCTFQSHLSVTLYRLAQAHHASTVQTSAPRHQPYDRTPPSSLLLWQQVYFMRTQSSTLNTGGCRTHARQQFCRRCTCKLGTNQHKCLHAPRSPTTSHHKLHHTNNAQLQQHFAAAALNLCSQALTNQRQHIRLAPPAIDSRRLRCDRAAVGSSSSIARLHAIDAVR